MIQFKVTSESAVGFDLDKPNTLDMTVERVTPTQGLGGVQSKEIDTIVVLDRGEYDSLTSRPLTTLYIIRG